MPLALDAGKYIGREGRHVVDIGAGIGRLAYAVLCANWWHPQQVQVTAVEINSEYVDEAASNPPVSQVLTDCDTRWLGYRGPAGLTVAALGLKVVRLGITLILPQTQTPYRYSGRRPGANVMAASHMRYLETFMNQHPELEWHHNSIDTEDETHKAGWRGATPCVELVSLCDPEAELVCLQTAPPIPRPICLMHQVA